MAIIEILQDEPVGELAVMAASVLHDAGYVGGMTEDGRGRLVVTSGELASLTAAFLQMLGTTLAIRERRDRLPRRAGVSRRGHLPGDRSHRAPRR